MKLKIRKLVVREDFVMKKTNPKLRRDLTCWFKRSTVGCDTGKKVFILLTSPAFVEQIGESPYVSQADGKPDAGENEFQFATPRPSLHHSVLPRRRLGRGDAPVRSGILVGNLAVEKTITAGKVSRFTITATR